MIIIQHTTVVILCSRILPTIITTQMLSTRGKLVELATSLI